MEGSSSAATSYAFVAFFRPCLARCYYPKAFFWGLRMERWETYYHSPLSSENSGFSGAGQVVENGSFVGGGQVAHLKTIDYCSQVKTGIFPNRSGEKTNL